MMKAFIRATGSYVPSRILSNHDLAKVMDTSDEWIFTHTGIHNRRIADPCEAASDLGAKAAEACLAACNADGGATIGIDDIDLIIVATATPDHPGFPSTAAIVQHKLGAKNAGAMDIAAACTGFIYALETARCFVSAGSARNVLVIGTEVFSRIVNWKDRSTCVLFGDGAGAVLVSAAEQPDHGEILKSYLRADGSGADFLTRKAGGSREPYIAGETPEADQYVTMNGRQVYIFAVSAIIETVNKMLEVAGLTIVDIRHIVPHQANRRILEAACKRAGWSEDKFHMNMDEYANTSAASIPIALDELYRAGRLKRGERILTVGFGAGLTYGGNIFYW
jgi:3-oxoacyl-[acyl-carrier-protein] synthase-3